MGPHGDRRDGAQSRRIKAEKRGTEWQDDIVCVFVLRYNLNDLDGRRPRGSPTHEVSQRVTAAECLADLL